MTTCSSPSCATPATMALRTTASESQGLKTLIFWDDTDAPKAAERLCGAHGAHLLAALARDLAAVRSA